MDWVEPTLKQSIASFYGTDFGRYLESFQGLLWSRDGKRPKIRIEHKGVDKRRYVVRFGIAPRSPYPTYILSK